MFTTPMSRTVLKVSSVLMLLFIAVVVITGCTQADRVSHNLSVEADNFNITRRLAVVNTVTDTPLLEIVGNFSIYADIEDGQLEVTVKDEEGNFKKHFVGMSPTVVYIIEDVSGADVSSYRYQISYLPESIIPVSFKDGGADEDE